MKAKAHAVYVSPNGIGTALVRSQVLPYLRSLREAGIDTTLIAFERGEAFPEGEFPRGRWVGLRPQPGAGLVAKLIDIVRGTLVVATAVLQRRADVVHARSYLPAAIALVASTVTRRPYVFDMRGFLGQEYVETGYWTSGDPRYRLLRWAERHLLRRAAAIVVLTTGAERRLRSLPAYGPLPQADITVIPCGVDLARFRPAAERSPIPTLVYSGSLGMWYLLPQMLRVYALARRLEPRLRLLLLNRGEHELIRSGIANEGLSDADVRIVRAEFGEMPGLLAQAHVGIALIRQLPSKVGSSPIKVAEYLACGVPVVVNAGMGDTDELVRRYGAGHVLDAFGDADLGRAAEAVVRLVQDEDARRNARRLAEAELDVREGARRYVEMYERVVTGVRR